MYSVVEKSLVVICSSLDILLNSAIFLYTKVRRYYEKCTVLKWNRYGCYTYIRRDQTTSLLYQSLIRLTLYLVDKHAQRYNSIHSFRLRDNSVHFHECSPFCVKYFYNMYYSKRFEIVFSLNVTDTNICPCSHYVRLSYAI